MKFLQVNSRLLFRKLLCYCFLQLPRKYNHNNVLIRKVMIRLYYIWSTFHITQIFVLYTSQAKEYQEIKLCDYKYLLSACAHVLHDVCLVDRHSVCSDRWWSTSVRLIAGFSMQSDLPVVKGGHWLTVNTLLLYLDQLYCYNGVFKITSISQHSKQCYCENLFKCFMFVLRYKFMVYQRNCGVDSEILLV